MRLLDFGHCASTKITAFAKQRLSSKSHAEYLFLPESSIVSFLWDPPRQGLNKKKKKINKKPATEHLVESILVTVHSTWIARQHLFLSIQQRLLGNIRCELGDLQLLCLWAHFTQPMGSPEGRTGVVCPFDQDYFPSFTPQGSVLWFRFSSLENQGVFFGVRIL